ncbi:hypothetical protein H920_06489 [Fukomys damarensis]|uniref:Uncharacterized protein n=1 Tax=Fukomys damarensis TaxID=885580 RepID=A0A091DNV4_FUKDA|nr:hypothetical protein H920_06489 [Fukomys damarensis]
MILPAACSLVDVTPGCCCHEGVNDDLLKSKLEPVDCSGDSNLTVGSMGNQVFGVMKKKKALNGEAGRAQYRALVWVRGGLHRAKTQNLEQEALSELGRVPEELETKLGVGHFPDGTAIC